MYVLSRNGRHPYTDENPCGWGTLKRQREFESKTCELTNDPNLVDHPSDGGPGFPRSGSFIAELRETRLQHGVPTNENETKELRTSLGNNCRCGIITIH